MKYTKYEISHSDLQTQPCSTAVLLAINATPRPGFRARGEYGDARIQRFLNSLIANNINI